MKYQNETVVNSLAIKFLEQLLTKGTSVIVSIVLARLLDVEDFGVIAILTVFTNMASAIIEGGLSTSLIQMKEVDDRDYSTVFYTSGLLSVLLYGILFVTAPYIATAYESPELSLYLRITGVMLFLTPFNATQLGYVYRNMQFKRLFISSVSASLLSGVCGIVLAMLGAGVWALIAQIVSASVTSVLVLFLIIPWKPKLQFSFARLKQHFSYGWKMLVSSLVDTLYIDLQALIIGKRYTKDDLAYYNNGDKYPKMLITSLNTAVQSVMLPVLSAEQDDKASLKKIMRKTVSYSSFLLFPIILGFAAVAENFVLLALTEKWSNCVIYLQLACFAYAIRPINSCNLQAIKAIGRSDIFLHLTLIKKVIGIAVLILTAVCFQTPLAIAIGVALCAPLELVINIIPNRKLIGYSLREQLSDIVVPLLLSLLMFAGVYSLTYLSLNIWLELMIQLVFGVVIYAVLTFLFKRELLMEGINLIKHKLIRKGSNEMKDTKSTKKLLIIGASILQLPAIKLAKELGYYVGVIDYNPNAIGIPYADEYFNVSTIDIEGVMKTAESFKPNGIMTLATDMPMRSIAAACEKLGLCGISLETAIKSTDKGEMIRTFDINGVEHPWYYILSKPDELEDVIANITFPCISKPTDNSGSRGVMLICNETELRDAVSYSSKNGRSGGVIVEEYMIGPEVSVEVMAVNGQPHVLQVTDKLTTGAPHFVEMGHSQPSRLPTNDVDKIKDLACRAVKAVGIQNGPAHVEIILTANGPKMVELGARMGGDCITTHLVPLSTGVNMIESTIRIACGETPDIERRFNKGSAIRYFNLLPGTIKEIHGVEEASRIKGVCEISFVKNVGDSVGSIGSSTDRVGFVIAQADTVEEAVHICEHACEMIKIVTE